MRSRNGTNLALFCCQSICESSEADRKFLEEKCGDSLRLHVIPCSGRVEPFDLLQALEKFADAAYVIACTNTGCRYFKENRRAHKQVQRAQWIIRSIGLDQERIGIIVKSKKDTRSLAKIAEEVLDSICKLGPSPVHQEPGLEKTKGKSLGF